MLHFCSDCIYVLITAIDKMNWETGSCGLALKVDPENLLISGHFMKQAHTLMIQQSCLQESVIEGTVFPFLFEKILASFSKIL